MGETRILGIDPGLNTTGYAIIAEREGGPQLVEAGVIRTSEGRAPADMEARLKVLYDGMCEVIDQFAPTSMSIEQLYAHYNHPRTAILMGHARGVILLAGGQRGLPVFSYAATQIKKAVTGSGRAAKEQIQLAMLHEFRLSCMPEPHDVADAMAIALCHYHLRESAISGNRGSDRLGRGVNLRALLGEDRTTED